MRFSKWPLLLAAASLYKLKHDILMLKVFHIPNNYKQKAIATSPFQKLVPCRGSTKCSGLVGLLLLLVRNHYCQRSFFALHIYKSSLTSPSSCGRIDSFTAKLLENYPKRIIAIQNNLMSKNNYNLLALSRFSTFLLLSHVGWNIACPVYYDVTILTMTG